MDEAFRVRRGSGNHTAVGSGSIVDWLLREDAAGRFNRRDRRRIADRFVLSHLVLAGPGDPPMYTAGLRFYQVKDTAYRLPVGGAGDSSVPAEDGDGVTTEDNGDRDGDHGFSTLPPVDGEKPHYYQLTVYKDSGRLFSSLHAIFFFAITNTSFRFRRLKNIQQLQEQYRFFIRTSKPITNHFRQIHVFKFHALNVLLDARCAL